MQENTAPPSLFCRNARHRRKKNTFYSLSFLSLSAGTAFEIAGEAEVDGGEAGWRGGEGGGTANARGEGGAGGRERWCESGRGNSGGAARSTSVSSASSSCFEGAERDQPGMAVNDGTSWLVDYDG